MLCLENSLGSENRKFSRELLALTSFISQCSVQEIETTLRRQLKWELSCWRRRRIFHMSFLEIIPCQHSWFSREISLFVLNQAGDRAPSALLQLTLSLYQTLGGFFTAAARAAEHFHTQYWKQPLPHKHQQDLISTFPNLRSVWLMDLIYIETPSCKGKANFCFPNLEEKRLGSWLSQPRVLSTLPALAPVLFLCQSWHSFLLFILLSYFLV